MSSDYQEVIYQGIFEKLASFWSMDITGGLETASDELRAKFAELFELYVTVHPNKSSKGYHFEITGSIPLEIDGNTVSTYDMVFSPPRGGHRGRG